MLLLALTLLATAPSDQSLVYYNARLALREGRSAEVVKLWLLRNAVESRTGKVSAHDGDFRSVTWAAMGDLGLCQDGYPKDDQGAGLWPLAQHNWLVRNMRRPPPPPGASPFKAFDVGRQQRHVSIHDVLDATELKAARFHRGSCWLHLSLLVSVGESWSATAADKRVTARLLRHLLRQSLTTLRSNIVGRSVIKARIFDLNLRLAGLQERAARRARIRTAREARRSGLSRTELATGVEPEPSVPPDSEEGRILRDSLSWSAAEWLAMSPGRRQFLFAHAARTAETADGIRPLILAVLDRLIEARRGAEVESWIAHLGATDDATRALVWDGDRGRRLLALDRESGFRGRAVVALHRGVAELSAGRLPDALRSLAHAVKWAEGARAGEAVRNLSRRWLSFVASRFRVTDELFAMLRSVVPRADYSAVLEDQLWHAALRADAASFDRCVRYQVGRGALVRRAQLLRPLAHGDPTTFSDALAERLAESPHATLRFLRTFLERLQAQALDIRATHLPTLRALQAQLEAEVERGLRTRRATRGADALLAEVRAVIEGLAPAAANVPDADAHHTLSPEHEVYAGTLRVAPSDPLPWPFRVAPVEAPPAFTPIELRPEEWRTADGARVFGWRLGD